MDFSSRSVNWSNLRPMAVGIAARSEWAEKVVPAGSLIKAATSLSSLFTILIVMSLPERYWKTGLDGSLVWLG